MLSRSEADILSALVENPSQPLTAREISDHTGIREPMIRRVATTLAYAGLASQAGEDPAAWRITDTGCRVLKRASESTSYYRTRVGHRQSETN